MLGLETVSASQVVCEVDGRVLVTDCMAVCNVYGLQNSDRLNECEQILSAQGMVTALCIDSSSGAIVAGVQKIIR